VYKRAPTECAVNINKNKSNMDQVIKTLQYSQLAASISQTKITTRVHITAVWLRWKSETANKDNEWTGNQFLLILPSSSITPTHNCHVRMLPGCITARATERNQGMGSLPVSRNFNGAYRSHRTTATNKTDYLFGMGNAMELKHLKRRCPITKRFL
jgi:hypothetical protein